MQLDSINAASHTIGFFLALQISELTRLQKNLEDRIEELENISSSSNIKKILQGFTLCGKIGIDLENLASKILSSANKKIEERLKHKKTVKSEDITQILQRVFISDKNYLEIITMLGDFSQTKDKIVAEKGSMQAIQPIIYFAQENMPVYLEKINLAISYEKKTLDLFKNKIRDHFNLEVKVALEE